MLSAAHLLPQPDVRRRCSFESCWLWRWHAHGWSETLPDCPRSIQTWRRRRARHACKQGDASSVEPVCAHGCLPWAAWFQLLEVEPLKNQRCRVHVMLGIHPHYYPPPPPDTHTHTFLVLIIWRMGWNSCATNEITLQALSLFFPSMLECVFKKQTSLHLLLQGRRWPPSVVKGHGLSIEADDCQMEAELVHSCSPELECFHTALPPSTLSVAHALSSPLFSSPQSACYANS